MEPDPWNWTVEDVQAFFRYEAAEYISDIPNVRLPPLEPFLDKLSQSDVSGSVLLTIIDAATLREDLGVNSLGVRTAVLHCIGKLRRRSITYTNQHGPQQHQPPTTASLTALPAQPELAFLPPQDVSLPALEAVGEHLRSGEVQFQDAHGRKRRKLDLTKLQDASPQDGKFSTDFTAPLAARGYLGDAHCAIDEIFYGQTPRGKVIGELEATGDVLIHRADRDAGLEDRNFQFNNQYKAHGESRFVYSKLRHFLMGEEAIELRRNEREAMAYFPYRAKDALQDPSAVVLQFQPGEEDAVAVREGYVIRKGVVHFVEDPGEWDFLLEDYPENENDLLLSDSVDDGTVGATNVDDEDDSSQMADVDNDEDESFLKPEHMEQVFESFIDECVEKWSSRLPNLEQKRAWTVWKQMKRSRTLRDALIEGAQAQILHLTGRIEKMKEQYAESTWHNQEALRKACVSMEPTIADIEELRWKISIWERKQEPGHTARRLTQGKREKLQSEPSDRTMGGAISLHIHPDDRFSASPPHMGHDADHGGVQIIDEDDALIIDGPNPQDDIKYDEDEEAYHAPRSSRHASSVEPFIVPDPASDGDVFDEGTSETLAIDTATGAITDDDALSLQAEEDLSDSEDLPDMSTLVAPALKTPSRPEIQPIDLTNCSSDNETPKKRGRGRPPKPATILNRTMQGDPAEASASTVKSWDWETLIEKTDRRRILMKILFEAGHDFQDCANESYRRLTSGLLIARLEPALRAHRVSSTSTDLQDRDTALMAKLAPIYICWYVPCHPEKEEQVRANLRDIDWNSILSRNQLSLFTQMLSSILAKRKKHFVSPKTSPLKLGSSSTPIDLSSGIESDTPRSPIARRKRKKEVKRSAAALDSRLIAMNRQKKFAESQTTDPAQLLAMMNSDLSVSSIVINLLREDDDQPIYITNKIARKMKGHQIEGVQFMWREITAEGGQGCILAHTMGLGKTMQTIALLVALNECAQSHSEGVSRQLPAALQKASILEGRRAIRALVLCPTTLKQNWQQEIAMWAGNKLGPVIGIENTPNKASPAAKLKEWKRHGGVALIGYEYFRSLLARKLKKDEDPELRSAEVEKLEKLLLETPEIVVADEAHNVKNETATVSKLAKRFKTESRIALTGTPMSNDVDEIYALVNWSAPGFLGDPQEFRAHFTEPIKAGLYSDSTPSEKRKSIMKLKVLHSEIGPKVHRANIEVLRGSLRSKTEFVITLPLTQTQTEMYRRFMQVIQGARSDNASQVAIFGWLSDLTILTTHPHCLRKKLLAPPPPRKKRSPSEERDLGGCSPSTATEEGSPAPVSGPSTLPGDSSRKGDERSDVDDEDAQQEAARLHPAEVEAILHGLDDDFDPGLSAKITVLRELLDLSLACGDKILIFSGSIPTLDYVAELLSTEGKSYGRIDGSIQPQKRMKLLERFENSEFEIMLISSKAGGVGLNIQSANRVIIMDFKWNPAVEEQAIGRAYRLGQLKPVFVYRLVTGGTFEKNLYNQQLFKTSLAQRVIDKKNPRRNAQRDVRQYLYEPKDVKQENITEEIGKDGQVLDKLLQAQGNAYAMIRSIDTMETLQEDAMDAPLDAEEQKMVDEEIQFYQQRGRGANRYVAYGTMGQSYPLGPTSTAPYAAAGPSMAAFPAPASTWQPSNHSSHSQPNGLAPQPYAPYLGGLPAAVPKMTSQPY